jgi:hypothetical protein
MITEIRIDVTKGNKRLVIDGPLDLLHEFMENLAKSPCDPAPAILPNTDNPLTSHLQSHQGGHR